MNDGFRVLASLLVLAVVAGAVPRLGTAQDQQREATETGERAAGDTDGEAEQPADEGPSGEKPADRRAETYELDELLRRAKTNDDLLDEFQAKREQAEWKKYRAKWAPAPKVNSLTTVAPVPANADPDQINRNYEEIGAFNVGPFVNHDTNLVVPVYTFGRISTLRELADLGVEVSDLKKREAQLNAVFQTKRAYYSLQLSRAYSPILQKGDERIEEKLQEMEDARDFGEADFETKDFRKLQIFSSRVDIRISENQKLASISTRGLKYLADLSSEEVDVGKLSEDAPLAPLGEFETYLEAAMENRPELNQLDKGIQARKLQVQLEKRKSLPNVFVSAGVGAGWSNKEKAFNRVCVREGKRGPCENTEDPDLWARPESNPFSRFSLSIGAGIRWNVDPLQQHGKIQEKQAKLRTLQAQKRRATGAIRTELRKKYDDAADQRNKVEINDRRLEAARKWRNQKGLTMKTAGKNLDEIDDAVKPLKEYYKAKAKYLEARYRYKVAKAALAQAVGVESLRPIEKEAGLEYGGGENADDESSE